jgi:predicted nucleotidyltransferase component of viral defense system
MTDNKSLFDKVVTQALDNSPSKNELQIVVEKELLHHDIIREMAKANLLSNLTFIGGTCLRAVHGSDRLSEDLDFTGGFDFNSQTMSELATVIRSSLKRKYQLDIDVSESKKEGGNVDTWKIKVITRPNDKSVPTQRINIDICSIPSHDIKYDTLKNHYPVDMGTSSLIIPVQSKQEIFADKIVAMAFRPNRLKHRDLWDIVWLVNQSVKCPSDLVSMKIADHNRTETEFVESLTNKLKTLPSLKADFYKEMSRFIPSNVAKNTLDNPNYWGYLVDTVTEQATKQIHFIEKSANNTMNAKDMLTTMSVDEFLAQRKVEIEAHIKANISSPELDMEALKHLIIEHQKCSVEPKDSSDSIRSVIKGTLSDTSHRQEIKRLLESMGQPITKQSPGL